MHLCWDLFVSFFKIGLFTFGGGYAMLPLIQKEMIRHKWATDQEILDYYALSQMTPGIIAVNVSTFIGYKLKGWLGAICAMLGVVMPSLIIITTLVLLIQNVWQMPITKKVFESIQLMVPALIVPIVVRMVYQRATNFKGILLMLLALILVFLNFSPILILLICGSVSGFLFVLKGQKGFFGNCVYLSLKLVFLL